MTRTQAIALYCATLLIFAAMTPLRWWLQGKIGMEYQTPDLMFGLDVPTLDTFREAMARPVGNWTGGDWFKLMHTYTLDLALPAMTGLSFAVFFLRAARKLPNFAKLERKAQWAAAFIVGFHRYDGAQLVFLVCSDKRMQSFAVCGYAVNRAIAH